MFKVFSKGFNELFGGFVVIFGATLGFVGFILLLVGIVKFLETMVGTVWAIILMCIFITVTVCAGNGLYHIALYKNAKKSYELNKQKREEILDMFEEEVGHRNIYMPNFNASKYKYYYDDYTLKMNEAKEKMNWLKGKYL